MSELLDKAAAAVETARAKGAQGARASVSRSRSSKVEWRDGKLDRLRESTSMSLGVTLYVDGRYSAHRTSDLRPEALDAFLAETVSATRVLAKDPHRKLPEPARYQSRSTADLELYDEQAAGKTSARQRRSLASTLEQAARGARGANKLISVTASASENVYERALVCSNGMKDYQRSSTFSMSAFATVRDVGDRKPAGGWWAVQRQRAKLPSVKSVGLEATRRALMKVGAKPEKSGKYACIIENMVTGRLLRGLLSAMNGQAIQQKRSFLGDKLNKPIANKLLTVVDNPLLLGALGSRRFDGEGMTAVERPVIEAGRLMTFFLDTYYASKLGKEPTTGSRSNLVFTPGAKDLAALMKAMGKGILVTGFSGGNSNSATGDFSVGVIGQWIENGKPVRPITEMNLAGNHLSFWKKLGELGADPNPYSSTRCPSLLFDKVQFSGV